MSGIIVLASLLLASTSNDRASTARAETAATPTLGTSDTPGPQALLPNTAVPIPPSTDAPTDSVAAPVTATHTERATAAATQPATDSAGPPKPVAPALLGAPSNVQASDGTFADKVRITWQAVTGATVYRVFRAPSLTGTKISLGTLTGTIFDDTAVTQGTIFYYCVAALNGTQQSSCSAFNAGWRSSVSAPTSVQASDGTYTDKVLITWRAASAATSYRVLRASSSAGTKSLLGTATATSFNDTSATPGTVSYYWVMAYKGTQHSGYSAYNTGWRKVAPPKPALRVMADQLGITVGVELNTSLTSNATYQQIVGREFNLTTIDAGLYWNTSEPQRGQILLSLPDEQLPFAQARNMAVRGHPLVYDGPGSWGSDPAWLLSGQFSRDEWISIVRNHVTQVVSHFRGRIDEWVVANEALNTGPFESHLGADYLEQAFRAARAADPGAKLIYNAADDEIPYAGSRQTYSTPLTQDIVRRLKNKGLIDGVGLQMHVLHPAAEPSKEDMIAVMRSYGVPVYITESDVDLTSVPGTRADRFKYQASIYARITDACLESGVCKSITFWGIGDKYSWLEWMLHEPNADATLYDDNLQPKPAYFAVQASLYNHLHASTQNFVERVAPQPESVSYHPAVQFPSGDFNSHKTVRESGSMVSTGASTWTCYDDHANPCNSSLNAIDMVASNDGWAVGDGGLILRRDGTNWLRVLSPTTADLRSVSAVTSNDVWAVGYQGVILHWNGTAWARVSSPNPVDFRSVKMVSATDGWAVAEHAGPSTTCPDYFRWDGTTWSNAQALSTVPCLWSMGSLAFRSASNMAAVGFYGYVAEWNGTAWQFFLPGTYKSFRAAAFASDSDLWAVGDSGAIFHLDGSRAWTDMSGPTDSDLAGISFTSPSDGWAVGANGTILHWDGSTWSLSSSPTDYDLNSISMLSASDGWAVGDSTILHWDGTSWSLFKQPSPTREDLTSVSLTSASDGWAVGYGGSLLHWDGAAWSLTRSPTTYPLYSIALPSSSSGWAVGTRGLIVHFNGTSWSRVVSRTSSTLYSVAFAGPAVGWAVGAHGTILRWNGTAWSSVPSPTSNDLTSVSTTSSGTEAWAVGNGSWGFGSTILHWNGGSWSSVAHPTTNSLSAVSVVSANNAWAVGQMGRILHWNGAAWSAVPSSTTRGLLAVRMASATDGWATGVGGTILHWNVTSWSTIATPSTRALYSIAWPGLRSPGAWIVGSGGTMLQYSGTP